MKTITVAKKKYILTQTEASAIREVLRLLSQITDDDDIADTIQIEACSEVEDTEELLNTILNLEGKDIEC